MRIFIHKCNIYQCNADSQRIIATGCTRLLVLKNIKFSSPANKPAIAFVIILSLSLFFAPASHSISVYQFDIFAYL